MLGNMYQLSTQRLRRRDLSHVQWVCYQVIVWLLTVHSTIVYMATDRWQREFFSGDVVEIMCIAISIIRHVGITGCGKLNCECVSPPTGIKSIPNYIKFH